MRRSYRALLGLLVAALAGLVPAGAAVAALVPGPAAAPAPAAAPVLPASASSCVAGGGVWVLAITGDGSIVAQGCSSHPSTGRQALTSVASVVEREQGFVCQINSAPNRCAPSTEWTPTTPMWRYSYATPGGSWTYSNWGYDLRQPPAGSIEGWCLSPGPCESTLASVLNPGSVPGYVPDPPSTKAPTTKAPTTKAPTTKAPTTKAPTTTKAATTAPATRATSQAPASSATTAASTATPAASQSPGETGTTPAATPTTASTDGSAQATSPVPTDVSAEPTATTVVATQPPGGTGTPWGAIATGGLIAAAAGAFAIVRVRRGRTAAADEIDLDES